MPVHWGRKGPASSGIHTKDLPLIPLLRAGHHGKKCPLHWIDGWPTAWHTQVPCGVTTSFNKTLMPVHGKNAVYSTIYHPYPVQTGIFYWSSNVMRFSTDEFFHGLVSLRYYWFGVLLIFFTTFQDTQHFSATPVSNDTGETCVSESNGTVEAFSGINYTSEWHRQYFRLYHCITDVKDTGEELLTGINDTGEAYLTTLKDTNEACLTVIKHIGCRSLIPPSNDLEITTYLASVFPTD